MTATITGEGKKHLVDLHLVGAGSGGGGPPATKATITATDGHPMFVPGTGWVEAGDLETGDRLVDDTGHPVRVAAVTHRTADLAVHNLSIADRHTYYVRTAAGVTALTHNSNPSNSAACGIPVKSATNSCKINSFTADTPVLMADGTTRAIKAVGLGDRVMAADPFTGGRGPRRVVDLIRHSGPHTMVAIQLADGTVINSTDRHPFWVSGRAAWVDAIDLGPGDRLAGADGRPAVITATGTRVERLTAYNLAVEDLHTYYAGDTPVLVHNDGRGSYPIDLGEGYSGRIDRFPMGQGADFEIHVVRGKSEVGVFGSSGWFSKHSLGNAVSVPGAVTNRLKGLAVNELRAAGRLGAKGTMDITGDKWTRPRLTGGC